MKQALVAAIVPPLLTLSSLAGSISVQNDIKYPTQFETHTRVINGKVTTVTIPSSFETRSTGTRMRPSFVGVSKLVKKDAWGKDVVHVRFDDGQEGEVTTGRTYKIAGVEYRALGWRGKDYCLMNLENRKIVKFRPMSEPES